MSKDFTLDDVRAAVRQLHEEGKRIQSHYKRLDQEYSDWEDRLNALDVAIHEAELETGLKREEIINPMSNELTDDLGSIEIEETDDEILEKILRGDSNVRPDN